MSDVGPFVETTNILSRVTGGIFGEINTTDFGLANLYLINPAGVVFGRGADLNVGGSVRVSTADYLKLSDGALFNAVPGPQDAMLSIAPITAFGFLDVAHGPISVNGAELPSVRNELSLIGGDITMTGGQLSAPGGGLGGQIDLVSVASANEVTLRSGNFPLLDNESNLGNIRLSDGALVSSPGGNVFVRAGNLVIDNARIDAGSTLGGGEIVVLASGDVSVRDSPTALSVRGADRFGPTPGGSVRILANRVRFVDSGIDASGTTAVGEATEANVFILGSQTVRIEGDSRIDGGKGGSRSSVAIDITSAGTVSILDGAVLAADNRGLGNAGTIRISAANDLNVNGSHIDARATGSGDAGEIFLTSIDNNVVVRRSELNAEATGEQLVEAGVIHISATERNARVVNSRLTVNNNGVGPAGSIRISTGIDLVSGQETFVGQDSSFLALTGEGQGGTIEIQAPQQLRLTNSLVRTDGSVGGTIELGSRTVRLQNSQVKSNTGDGTAGTITIRTNNFRVDDQSTVEAVSLPGTGTDGTFTVRRFTAP